MKRSYIGAGFLIFLCLLCAGCSWAMTAIHGPISGQLLRAQQQVLVGAFPQGRTSAVQAKAQWEKLQHFRSCISDHTPVEQIDAGFAELESYGASGEDAAFAAKCAELAQQVKAVGEAQELTWWNIF